MNEKIKEAIKYVGVERPKEIAGAILNGIKNNNTHIIRPLKMVGSALWIVSLFTTAVVFNWDFSSWILITTLVVGGWLFSIAVLQRYLNT